MVEGAMPRRGHARVISRISKNIAYIFFSNIREEHSPLLNRKNILPIFEWLILLITVMLLIIVEHSNEYGCFCCVYGGWGGGGGEFS